MKYAGQSMHWNQRLRGSESLILDYSVAEKCCDWLCYRDTCKFVGHHSYVLWGVKCLIDKKIMYAYMYEKNEFV